MGEFTTEDTEYTEAKKGRKSGPLFWGRVHPCELLISVESRERSCSGSIRDHPWPLLSAPAASIMVGSGNYANGSCNGTDREDHMNCRLMRVMLASLFAFTSVFAFHAVVMAADVPEIATLRTGGETGFSNAGWKYDRYAELPSLDAGRPMTVADLQGPGIIRQLHITRHQPKEIAARGVVLEIWFDDAKEPAVHCPLADFFGDGCNGQAMDFSTDLIECAPWSYNAYFPMPFKTRARVVLRNDTDRNLMNYSYVEWERLPRWKDEYAYFHATYQRRAFQLTKDTAQTFFEVQGNGQLIGRQYSVETDEPLFRGFDTVMEGNNEVDIDGQSRKLDYLGTEDSFTFSWGFQRTFAGRRAGMTLVKPDLPCQLSIFRFHDHLPIRFTNSLRWRIDWTQEHFFTARPEWAAAVARNGCWVDYATVYYWYQSVPGGYRHAPLPPVAERGRFMSRPAVKAEDLGAILEKMTVDPSPENALSRPDDLGRLSINNTYRGTHPFWIDEPKPVGGHPGNPNPGKRGILAVHAESADSPCYILRKVTLSGESKLRLVVSGDPYENPGGSDFVLQAGVWDGQQVHWFDEQVIEPAAVPDAKDWRTLEYDLKPYAGKTVGLIVKVAYGGPKGVFNEEAFFDEISVVPN